MPKQRWATLNSGHASTRNARPAALASTSRRGTFRQSISGGIVLRRAAKKQRKGEEPTAEERRLGEELEAARAAQIVNANPHGPHIGSIDTWFDLFKCAALAAAAAESRLPGVAVWLKDICSGLSDGKLVIPAMSRDLQLALCCVVDGAPNDTILDSLILLAMRVFPWLGNCRLHIGCTEAWDNNVSRALEPLIRLKAVDVIVVDHTYYDGGKTPSGDVRFHFAAAMNTVAAHARQDGATLLGFLKAGQVLGETGIEFVLNGPPRNPWGIRPEDRDKGLVAMHLVSDMDDGTVDTVFTTSCFFAAVGGFDLDIQCPFSGDFSERAELAGSNYLFVRDPALAGVDVGPRWQDAWPHPEGILETARELSRERISQGLVIRNDEILTDGSPLSYAPLPFVQVNLEKLSQQAAAAEVEKAESWARMEAERCEGDAYFDDDDYESFAHLLCLANASRLPVAALRLNVASTSSWLPDKSATWTRMDTYLALGSGQVRNLDPTPSGAAGPGAAAPVDETAAARPGAAGPDAARPAEAGHGAAGPSAEGSLPSMPRPRTGTGNTPVRGPGLAG